MEKLLKVLMIEDSEADCLLIERHLQEHGLLVWCSRVASFAELQLALETDGWDVILSNYSVLQLHLPEYLRLIQAQMPEVPVILVSGSVGEEKAVDLLKEGFWDFVLKDGLERLVPAMERCIREAKVRRARRETEQKARLDNEERLNIALTAAHMGIWEWDLRTNALIWSPECFEILGVPQSSLTRDSFTNLLHPDDAARVMSAARRAIAEKECFREEFRIIRPEGKIIWISSYARADYDTAGNPLKMVGTNQEITARKEMEEALRESESKYRRLFDAAHDVIVFLDREGNIVDINPRGAELTGYAQSDLRKMNVFQHLLVPEDHALIRQVVKDAFAGLERVYEEHWKTKEGKIITFDGLTVPRRSPDGEVLSTFCTLRDVTGYKLAQETVRLYAKELEETNNALKVLLRQREEDRRTIEEKVHANVTQLVLPFVELLKKSKHRLPEDYAYLNILETNLREIISSFTISLARKISNLTPKEILIANLVKAGRHDKDIAAALSLSVATVKAHRRNIRKKLGISGEKTNLRSYLSDIINT